MIVRAKLNNYRMSARKVRLVANLIRGKRADEVLTMLAFTNKQAAPVLANLVKSALANAKNNYNLNDKDLVVKEITVDEAVTYKRWMPRAMGRATPVRKRGSHISVGLASLEEVKEIETSKDAVKSENKEVKKAAVKKKTVANKKTTAKKTVKTVSKKSEADNK